MTIVVDGVDSDTIKISLDAIEPPAPQAFGNKFSLPHIDRLRAILRGGQGQVTDASR